jgi:putative hydrolase of the HAD superfamily
LHQSRNLTDVRAVVFDAVGTVLHPNPAAALVYAESGRKHGCAAPPEVIRERFTAAFRRQDAHDHQNELRTSEARERERWQQIVAEVLFDADDPASCFLELFDHFSQPRNWQIDPDASATLAALAKRGIGLALASNFDRRLHSVVAGFPSLAPIRCVIVSSEVGWRKPARQFFDTVCHSVGEPAEKILFLGDDLVNDYEGARAAGMRALLFDPRGLHPKAQGIGAFSELCS